MTDTKPFFRVRKPLESFDFAALGVDDRPTMNEQLELLVAQGSSPGEAAAISGRAYATRTTSAVAAVVAIPTTAVMLAFYNTEADDGESAVFENFFAQNVASTAVASQAQILVCIGQVRETAPTNALPTIIKMNGVGGGGGSSILTGTLTATALPGTTGVAANWIPWGPSAVKPGAATTPGYGIWAPVCGQIILPPGRFLGLHVIANVVGETFVIGATWREKMIKGLN